MDHLSKPWAARPLCLLLAALLLAALLAGCGAKPGAASGAGAAPAAMGRWAESEVSLPEGCQPTALYQLTDGTLWLIGADDARMCSVRWLSADGGETWQQSPLPAPLDACRVVDVSPGGAVLAQQYILKEEGAETRFWRMAPGGEPEPFSLPDVPGMFQCSAHFIDEEALAVSWNAYASGAALPGQSDGAGGGFVQTEAADAAEVSRQDDAAPGASSAPEMGAEPESSNPAGGDEGFYTVSSGGGVRLQSDEDVVCGSGIYSFADGRRLGDWPGMEGDALTSVSNGQKLFYEKYGAGFLAMDAAGGQETLYTGDSAGHLEAAFAEPDGTLYFANDQGIHCLAAGGSLAETVVEGSALAFARPQMGGQALVRIASGDFLLLLTDYNSADYKCTLYRYHFDETLPARGDTVLTVWSLEDNETVRAAIAAFAKIHPEAEVEYTVAQPAGAESPGREDLLRALNTELLAGGGPDVLILDGVDYAPYARQGLLADLSGTVSDLKLLDNITAPFMQGDAVYLLPARFTLPVLYAPKERLAAAASWEGMLQSFLDAPARPDVAPNDDGFFDALPEGGRYAFSVKDTADLVDMLLASSAPALLSGEGGLNDAALGDFYAGIETVARHYGLGSYRTADPLLDVTVVSSSSGEDAVISHQSSQEYSWGRALFAREWLGTPALLLWMQGRYDGEDTPMAAALQPGLAEGAYRPQVLAAVNAATAQEALAKDFVRTLLCDEVQGAVFYQDGLPVTQSGMQIVEERFKSARHFTPELLENFHALLAAAKTPSLPNEALRASLIVHAGAIAAGTETVQQAAAGTQKDLELYFAERG